MKIRLDDVIEAIEFTSDETEYYYYIPQERILMRNSFEGWVDRDIPRDIEPEDLIPLPTRREVDDYGNMAHFIEAKVKDEEAADWLSNAIRGRGAFRMFRAACERFGLIQEWYEFRENCHRATAILWCEENGIVYETERFLTEEDEDADDFPVEEAPAVVKSEPSFTIRTVQITDKNYMNLVFLKAACDAEMKNEKTEDTDEAQDILEEWLDSGLRVIAASEHGRYLGYMVLEENPEQLILKELYVRKDSRRKGIATVLLQKAEDIAEEEDCPGVTSRVTPDNRVMFAFLASLGYTTLDTVEISKSGEGDGLSRIQLGEDSFRIR